MLQSARAANNAKGAVRPTACAPVDDLSLVWSSCLLTVAGLCLLVAILTWGRLSVAIPQEAQTSGEIFTETLGFDVAPDLTNRKAAVPDPLMVQSPSTRVDVSGGF